MPIMGMKSFCCFMDYYLTVILIGSQLWSNIVCQQLPGYNIYTCPSVTVQRGLCIHVPCSFTVPSDVQLSLSTTGTWFLIQNGDAYVAASKNNAKHQTNGRFFLTGNVYRGDCSYSIEDPLPTDEGLYFFQIEDGATKVLYTYIIPYVDVIELTDTPIISSTRLVRGEEVTLTCTSPGRCWTTPQITWEGTLTDTRQKKYDLIYGDGRRTFHSNITFTPRKSHNNSLLFCKVTFKSGVTTVKQRVLNVEYGEKKFYDPSVYVPSAVEEDKSFSDPTVHVPPAVDEDKRFTDPTLLILAIIGPICLLLLALLAFACWRKRQGKPTMAEKPTSAEPEPIYANLKLSDITSAYDQLEPEIPAYIDVLGSDVGPALYYENEKKKTKKTNNIFKMRT
ncbi:sialic acid-binding Ig-like lectin 8 [Bufo bufo]|uniref:sialic acid-binding Ig-like lectin 8 n=1 Tax=Bufo bufo TaxID=8384 RepID=UPI001ABECD4C|nr:sialic acid-binding Ig-like lectin 8 [Bufo bufo]